MSCVNSPVLVASSPTVFTVCGTLERITVERDGNRRKSPRTAENSSNSIIPWEPAQERFRLRTPRSAGEIIWRKRLFSAFPMESRAAKWMSRPLINYSDMKRNYSIFLIGQKLVIIVQKITKNSAPETASERIHQRQNRANEAICPIMIVDGSSRATNENSSRRDAGSLKLEVPRRSDCRIAQSTQATVTAVQLTY